MINLVIFIILILIVTMALLTHSKNLFIYRPTKYDDKAYKEFKEELGEFVKQEDIHNIKIETEKNIILDTWFLKNKHKNKTFLYCHGNGGNVTDRLSFLKFWYGYGSIIIYDYRGYGDSTGVAVKSDCHHHQHDLQIVISKYQTQFDLSSKNIILLGESLGCSLVLWLATTKDYAGIVLLSPFYSLEEMMRHVLKYASVWMFVLNDGDSKSFSSDIWIKKISKKVPIIILHSKEDEVIPYDQAIALSELHPNTKLITITGTHSHPVITEEVISVISNLTN